MSGTDPCLLRTNSVQFNERKGAALSTLKEWKGRVPTRAEARGARVAAASVPASSQAGPVSSPVAAPAPAQFLPREVEALRLLIGSGLEARLGQVEARIGRIEARLAVVEAQKGRVRVAPASSASGALADKFGKVAGSVPSAGSTRSGRKRAAPAAAASRAKKAAPAQAEEEEEEEEEEVVEVDEAA